MTVLFESRPCPEPLRSYLTRVLGRRGMARDEAGPIELFGHSQVSSHESYVIALRLAGGGDLRLFAKSSETGREGHGSSGHGHWGGVAYEAEVYRQVLRTCPLPTAAYFATHRDGRAGQTSLLIECLEGAGRLNHHPEPDRVMAEAARWLGRFHAEVGSRVSAGRWPFLKRYDAAYYLAWARRTAEFAGELHGRFPWLGPLAAGFGEAVECLLSAPPVVIHGEYYPKNILYRGDTIYPVDWESAAVAAGEIDLAALTECWDDATVAMCRRAYQEERWPGGAPGDADRRLAAARMFVHFRWLGDLPELARDPNNLGRYADLERLGVSLGLLP